MRMQESHRADWTVDQSTLDRAIAISTPATLHSRRIASRARAHKCPSAKDVLGARYARTSASLGEMLRGLITLGVPVLVPDGLHASIRSIYRRIDT